MTGTAPTPPASATLPQLWNDARNPPAQPIASYTGKTVLITGANIGLGFDAATKFAALGASTLIFGVRSLERGNSAKVKIENKTGCDTNVIHVIKLDMVSFASIEAFVQEVSTKFPRIDVAVLNAGSAPATYELSPHGWEMSLQVNVISTAYLAILLLPKLRDTFSLTGSPPHLEIVSSRGHGNAKMQDVTAPNGILNKVNDKKSFGLQQYVNTKLLVMWAMRHIAAKVSPSEVIILSCCPGLCRTNLGRGFGIFMQIANSSFQKFFARSSEEGSRTLVSGTILGPEAHGGFWTSDKLWTLGVLVTSEEGRKLSDQFWNELLAVLQMQNPKAMKNW
ncbi:hypothetical protein B0O99DRAFT_614783 [Bisporella sp. PMI_857]|nr:hypothetical protein B0O99DRAFT_614783 [Bisporella sp. PMI_857]